MVSDEPPGGPIRDAKGPKGTTPGHPGCPISALKLPKSVPAVHKKVPKRAHHVPNW